MVSQASKLQKKKKKLCAKKWSCKLWFYLKECGNTFCCYKKNHFYILSIVALKGDFTSLPDNKKHYVLYFVLNLLFFSFSSRTIVSKPKEFAHLIKNKFGSADNINNISKCFHFQSLSSVQLKCTTCEQRVYAAMNMKWHQHWAKVNWLDINYVDYVTFHLRKLCRLHNISQL